MQLRKALATATDAKLQLQKTITKLREKNSAQHAELQTKDTALQSLEDISATEIAKAYHRAQQENLQLQARNEQLSEQLLQLQDTPTDLHELQEELAGADRYARTLNTKYKQLYDRWFTQAQHLNTVARDLLFYSAYYYRSTDTAGWSHEDYERHDRYQKLKANPPQRPTRARTTK